MEPSSPDSDSNFFIRAREAIIDFAVHKGPEILVGSGVSLLIAIAIILSLAIRGPETIVKSVEVPVKAQLVAVTVQPGDDLGSIGATYGRSRIEMVGFNLDLLRSNTAKCDRLERTSGNCRRDKFGEETLAFDAVWPGDIVLVIQQDALEVPALASTAAQ